ncbi:MAG: AAA family ATPase [Solirubrobacterales bacterium]
MSIGTTRPGRSALEFEARVASRHEPPAFRPGMVSRPRLVARLERDPAAPLVLVRAPAGYGKTTLLAEWAATGERRFAWITLGRNERDGVALLGAIVEALAEVEPAASAALAMLQDPLPNLDAVLPRLIEGLASAGDGLVLVLDDAHLADSEEAAEVIEAIRGGLPPRSQLVLAARSGPRLPVGRARAHRALVELGPRDLAMTREEGREVLEGVGLRLTDDQLDSVIAKTEGWPVAIYLAGLALAEQEDRAGAVARFAGDDRVVAEYLRDEFTSRIAPERRELLRRISILDSFSGELCDFVLERTGTGAVLAELSEANLLVIPLDRNGRWYRFHGLLATALRAELHREEPSLEPGLHERASAWYAEQGDRDRAVEHAISSGDTEQAGRLIHGLVPEYAAWGRNSTLASWLSRFSEEQVASSVALALAAFHSSLAAGRGDAADAWVKAAARAGGGSLGEPAGGPFQGGIWVARAENGRGGDGRGGVVEMLEDARTAARLEPQESPFRSVCQLIEGTALVMANDLGRGVEALKEGARTGAVSAPMIQVACLAQLAVLSLDQGDPVTAQILVSQARAQIDRSRLADYPCAALPIAAAALVFVRRGEVQRAGSDATRAARLLGSCRDMPPWFEVESHLLLARALLRLDRRSEVGPHLAQASQLLDLEPNASLMREWLAEASAELERPGGHPAAAGLTAAELRVLNCLPTHLSLREIAEEFVVSSNTVKTQAQSIYRKLGVSSRAEAVAAAREAGLLES